MNVKYIFQAQNSLNFLREQIKFQVISTRNNSENSKVFWNYPHRKKMSPRQWFSLLAFYISYLFFGASVFFHNEHKLEIERRAVAHAERIEINGNYTFYWHSFHQLQMFDYRP